MTPEEEMGMRRDLIQMEINAKVSELKAKAWDEVMRMNSGTVLAKDMSKVFQQILRDDARIAQLKQERDDSRSEKDALWEGAL